MPSTAIPILRVTSVTRAEAFYCGRLGFERRFAFRLDPAEDDPCYMGLARDGAWLHVSSFPGDGAIGSAVVVIVDEVDRLHQELVAKGIPIQLPPTDQTWGNREMYVRDPDGNALRFTQEGSD